MINDMIDSMIADAVCQMGCGQLLVYIHAFWISVFFFFPFFLWATGEQLYTTVVLNVYLLEPFEGASLWQAWTYLYAIST